MAVRKVVIYPAKVLREKAQPVEELTPEILQLGRDLVDTMKAYDGLGLSANQVGELWRMFALDLEAMEVGEGSLVLVNPEMIYYEGTDIDEEGCLSFPDLFFEVERHAFVTFRGKKLDLERGELKDVEINATGLYARALQHELDHLDGILFIDYLPVDERARKLKEWMENLAKKQKETEPAGQ